MTGKTLAHYQVLEKLGAGGMGEVWRARDTRLNRDVALKFLPAAFAQDPERLARFEREAQLLAQLNHQNIAAIYGFENLDRTPFLVLEYVPGENLKSPVPLEGVLPILRQLIDALVEAHEKGILHRDLKPANIKITPEGKLKVLDFGLAKAFSEEASAPDPSRSPTLSLAATRAGVLLGTAAYMSPEQVRASPLDRRTDIWSFGCVLYEMLAGRPAFEGKTVSDILAAVLRLEPDWSALPPSTPPRLRHLLRRCLEKDLQRRLRDIADAELDAELDWDVAAAAQSPQSPPRPRRPLAPWAVAAVTTAVAAVALWGWLRAPQPAPPAAVRFFVHPPEKAGFIAQEGAIAVSPDGRRLVLAVAEAGKRQLWVRSLDTLAAHPLPGTEGARYPFWSPDSRYVGFIDAGKLKKVDVLGGPPQTLCDAPQSQGATWSRDGVILFTPSTRDPLHRVSSAGGPATPLTSLDQARQEISHRWPYFLPDGKHFLFFARSSQPEKSGFRVGSLDSKEVKPLLAGDSNIAYAPPTSLRQNGGPGHLLFHREGTLMAQPFDPARLQISGEPFPVAEQLSFSGINSLASFSVSSNGVLAYVTGPGGSAGTELLWFDRTGKRLASAAPPGMYYGVDLSPDGRRAAVGRTDTQARNLDIWVFEFARGVSTRFTFDPASESHAVWSPDGNRIAFASSRGANGLYQKVASGEGNEELVLATKVPTTLNAWSPDGRFLIYTAAGKAATDLWMLPLTGDRAQRAPPAPYIESSFGKAGAQFSPDGARVAYSSGESGRPEVFVQPFPAATSGGRWQISTDGGRLPRWRRDGKELFYTDLQQRLMSVEVRSSPGFEARPPKLLFQTRMMTTAGGYHTYAVTADGQRFLINTLAGGEIASTPLTVWLNWQAAVKGPR